MALDVRPFINDAQRIQKETGIPASIILGQMVFESSGSNPGGMSGLAYNAKNLFGIKGVGTAGTYTVWSQEYDAGGGRVSGFRKYNSYYESMADHARLLQTPRYASKLQGAKTFEDFAKGIKAGGYATDPNYAGQLISIIKQNGLDKYDDGTPYTGEGSVPAGGGSDKRGIFTGVANGVIRALLILLAFVACVLFFAKAFPQVEATAKSGAKKVTKSSPRSKGYKKVKPKGGATNGGHTGAQTKRQVETSL
ncbi:glycoside hydrolase family 73 protein [Bacillus thuringiensis]|uniref:glycoside hydrolase family 73 protein n=1 Tax=Bacillus thuringiensis TaxID=1428 RepID=UPI000BFD11AD|nr:glucosaminidase domain-containing protein [Bacillus thuringiensis]PGM34760.1 N-acetylmuramoyl-L-alanine amidase [Bacillus thuringiensis]